MAVINMQSSKELADLVSEKKQTLNSKASQVVRHKHEHII